MKLAQQHSPIFFDLDSPYAERFRKLSTTSKDPSDNFRLELFPKSSQINRQYNEIPSVQLERIDSVRQQKDTPTELILKKRHSQEKWARKVVFYREHSQPQQVSRHNTNQPAISLSNNQNVKKRLTSLQRYFQETRSMQLPYRTQNRIYENQKFLTELQGFQANLSQVKKKDSNKELFAKIAQRSNSKRNRLSETRPKKLKIHDIENQNVKKEKQKIMIQKIIKQRLQDYRSNLINSQKTKNQATNLFQRPIQLSVQIQNMNNDVQEIQIQIKRLKRLKKENELKLKEVTSFFGFAY